MLLPGNRLLPAFAGLLLCLLLSACGERDSHEKIMRDTVNLLAQVATILEGATDELSSREAADRLDTLIDRFQEVAERNQAIGPPDPGTIQKLESAHREERARLQARLQKFTDVAFGPPTHPSLRKSLDRIGEILQTMR